MAKEHKDKTNYEPEAKERTHFYALEQGPHGRTLRAIDYGAELGVYFELSHPTEEDTPILLTAEQTAELAEWLSRSQGQVITRMPIKLLEICRRVAWQKGNKVKLQRGDKASLREVVRILQSIDNKELLNISGNALRKVKEDMYYKLTDQDLQTYKGFQWEIGKWVKAKGEGGLCTNGSSTSLFS